jgi:hypothetical protein
VRGVVLDLSQDGACTNLFENFRENSLNRDLSNVTTVAPPLFSLVINTFNDKILVLQDNKEICIRPTTSMKYVSPVKGTIARDGFLLIPSYLG